MAYCAEVRLNLAIFPLLMSPDALTESLNWKATFTVSVGASVAVLRMLKAPSAKRRMPGGGAAARLDLVTRSAFLVAAV